MTAQTNAPLTFRFMWQHPAHVVALGLGSGLSPFAPGTVGTLWSWLVFVLFQPLLTLQAQWAAVLLAWPLGWWACTITARRMNRADPGAIVWDEVAAFWLVLLVYAPQTWWQGLLAFALFRFFDAVKPGPVGWADRYYKAEPGQTHISWAQGWGIMFDDLVAAGCTLMVLSLARAF